MQKVDVTNYNSLLIELGWCMPLSLYALLINAEEYKFEAYSNFNRSTYRNQCKIGAANKVLSLSLPIQGGRHYRDAYRSARIEWSGKWPKEHLASLKAAYMGAPFFEHYLPDVEDLFRLEEPLLFNYNLAWHEWLCKMLKLKGPKGLTASYQKILNGKELDLRRLINFNESLYKYPLDPYFQTFDATYGFRQGLSILDCLFHLGPGAHGYLKNEGAKIIEKISRQ